MGSVLTLPRRRAAITILILTAIFGLQGCPKKRNVTAKCASGSLGKASADFDPTSIGNTSVGLLNTHQFATGYLLELDPRTRSGSVPLVVKHSDGDFAPPENGVDIAKLIAMNLELTATADLPKTVQAELTTKLGGESALMGMYCHRNGAGVPVVGGCVSKGIVG